MVSVNMNDISLYVHYNYLKEIFLFQIIWIKVIKIKGIKKEDNTI